MDFSCFISHSRRQEHLDFLTRGIALRNFLLLMIAATGIETSSALGDKL